MASDNSDNEESFSEDDDLLTPKVLDRYRLAGQIAQGIFY